MWHIKPQSKTQQKFQAFLLSVSFIFPLWEQKTLSFASGQQSSSFLFPHDHAEAHCTILVFHTMNPQDNSNKVRRIK